MPEEWPQQIHAWHDFYAITGTAAATLTGLMFVVVSLGPRTIARSSGTGVRAFVTPTVVHFATVLFVAALMAIPATTPVLAESALLVGGVALLAYLNWTRVHRQWRESNLDRDDWLWYVGLPGLSYLLLVAGALGIWERSELGLASVAAAVLTLVATGIRNSWDLVIFMSQRAHGDDAEDHDDGGDRQHER
ncbi:MAG TPA: hypothetical protein VFD92_10630 [Candidatus Binatia bacterium]|nr:hypothetical protein [Candidatus Binatia bacterium]